MKKGYAIHDRVPRPMTVKMSGAPDQIIQRADCCPHMLYIDSGLYGGGGQADLLNIIFGLFQQINWPHISVSWSPKYSLLDSTKQTCSWKFEGKSWELLTVREVLVLTIELVIQNATYLFRIVKIFITTKFFRKWNFKLNHVD